MQREKWQVVESARKTTLLDNRSMSSDEQSGKVLNSWLEKEIIQKRRRKIGKEIGLY